jgi:hypothetical protein
MYLKLIRLIEGNAKRDFAAGVYLSEAQNPITPHPHPTLHTVFI